MKKTLCGIPQLEKIKIIFQYTLVLVCAFLLGCFFTEFLSETVLIKIKNDIVYHFDIPFAECEKAVDFLNNFSKLVIKELFFYCILFFSVFTVLNYLISDAVLFCVGFDFGFSVCLLLKLLIDSESLTTHAPSKIEIFVYLITKLIYVLFFLYFCINLI